MASADLTFDLRLPKPFLDRLRASADAADRSLNSEIVARIAASFEMQDIRNIVREEIAIHLAPEGVGDRASMVANIRQLPDGRLSRQDAAKFLGRSDKTMADWQRMGIGPMPRKVGGRVFYYLRDLEAYRDTGAREAG